MTTTVRKWSLIAHIITSLGWLGAVAAFFVLNLVALASSDTEAIRASYLAMNLLGEFAIVPFSLATLVIGIIEAFGTPWGLLRYRWVAVKFLLTAGASALLVLHQFTAVARAAAIAMATPPGMQPLVGNLAQQLVGDAGVALVLLVAIAAISILKPWGLTRRGHRLAVAERGEAIASTDASANDVPLPLSLKLFVGAIGVILAGFAMMHHTGHNSHHH